MRVLGKDAFFLGVSMDRRRRIKARPARKKTGEMNKTEAAYSELLDARVKGGEIDSYRFESIKLRLADNTWFTPDFEVVKNDGEIEYHEVKACTSSGKMLIEDDANVKIKVAAEMYAERKFILCGRLPKKLGSGWVFKELGE